MENAKQFLENNNLMSRFRALMLDGKMLTMHSDRWSFVYDWVSTLNVAKPEGIETDLTYYWESFIK